MKTILFIVSFAITFLAGACATAPSGSVQIQKKCHPVDNVDDEWVCEVP